MLSSGYGQKMGSCLVLGVLVFVHEAEYFNLWQEYI